MDSSKIMTFKHTSLEKSKDVEECLAWKMDSIKEDGFPIDTGLADYIAFSVSNLEGQILQLKAVKKELVSREKDISIQIERIKEDGAIFLLENGIDKLDGSICSSVSVTSARDAKTTISEVKEFKINISEEEVQELLIGMGKAEMITKSVEKITNATSAKLRINKRKVITPEMID